MDISFSDPKKSRMAMVALESRDPCCPVRNFPTGVIPSGSSVLLYPPAHLQTTIHHELCQVQQLWLRLRRSPNTHHNFACIHYPTASFRVSSYCPANHNDHKSFHNYSPRRALTRLLNQCLLDNVSVLRHAYRKCLGMGFA